MVDEKSLQRLYLEMSARAAIAEAQRNAADERISKLEAALKVLLAEAEAFNVSGIYFTEGCFEHKGPALARTALEDTP